MIQKTHITETGLNGKIPPHDKDVEEAVLSSCLIDSSATSLMIEILGEVNVFYQPEHVCICDAIFNLYKDSQTIDILTVSNELKKNGKLDAIGGDFKLISLCQKVGSSAHLENHCRILQQLYIKRKSIEIGYNLTTKSYNDDVDSFDLLDESYKELDKISDWLNSKKSENFKSNVDDLFNRIESNEQGVPSCIEKLNKYFNGYHKQDLTILAGRPGMGKTAFMLNEALKQALDGKAVGIFSLEMSTTQLTARLFSNFANVDSGRLVRNKLFEDEKKILSEKRKEFEKLPIFISDQGAITLMQLKIQAKKWQRENKISMVFIDYLQLMKSSVKNGTRENEVGEISRGIKALAKEMNVPIMALSQLSRAVETRSDKRPILSDLRDSGSIEQDADNVLFCYRPEYYGIDEWDDDLRSPTKDEAEIIISKNRHGETASCLVSTNLKYMRFSNKIEKIEEPFNLPNFNLDDAF